MLKNKRRVQKEDHARILLTETLPYEVPAIFSNAGFYMHWTNKDINNPANKILDYLFIDEGSSDFTIPMQYKLRKDNDSSRQLSLMHPRTQIRFIEFYKNYNDAILESCSKSKFSIRRPYKIASKYHIPKPKSNSFKSRKVMTDSTEQKYQYLSSYFCYSGHSRLYKFFNSMEFIRLEQRFPTFWSLDISRFFDSIYTHSITWALKTKSFSKTHKNVKNSFGNVFDKLMQSSNYNETAGIIIGPEVSRIFAEVISQDLDREIENRISKYNLKHGEHYSIKRYVDDIFVFAQNEGIATIIQEIITESIKEYNLSLNKSKIIKTQRPFITQKTKSILMLNSIIDKIREKLICFDDESGKVKIRRILSIKKTTVAFINDIKSVCGDDLSSYELVSGYTISSLCNFLIDITPHFKKQPLEKNQQAELMKIYEVSLELIFHLYAISPSYGSSLKICSLTSALCTFVDSSNTLESNAIKSLIYTHIHNFLEMHIVDPKNHSNDKETSLEILNLLIILRELGDNFLISKEILENLTRISKKERASYFETIVILYYIQDDTYYRDIRKNIINSINLTLNDLSDVRIDSGKIYLMLDLLSCPYLEQSKKDSILKDLLKATHSRAITEAEMEEARAYLTRYNWFTSWENIDLMNMLEKKQLLKAY